ncbi:MAG TPA: metallophosphoesterase [Acetobacteraceae bacterium]|jgi:serine/threonine protein phosphatase 1|nr:metallophosphoesterase [Acetobacteraceae bacterium]
MPVVDVSPWTPAPFALNGETVFAVGDVHGCADHLQSLLDTIRTLAGESTGPRRLVYLGDLIDRGPDTLGVLRQWAEGPQAHGVDRVDRIVGNHEILMLLTLRGGHRAERANAMWQSTRMGGAGVLAEMRDAVRDPAAPPSLGLALAALGRTTVDLLLTQRAHLRLGNTLFVHGGLDGRSDPDAFLAPPWTAGVNARWAWITRGFLDWQGGFGGTLVVHGHTPPAKHRTFSGMADPHVLEHDRLSLDGGSALTGVVVAAEIQDGRYRLLKAHT